MIIYVWIVCLLFMGFLLLFGRMRWLEKLWELLHRTREGMDRASQLRAVENRHRLMEFQQKNTSRIISLFQRTHPLNKHILS